ncbi:MAG: HlyD family efflux transporter periplasmic adaptor subunit, partial [Deltaproteobacteria bacterium]
SKQSVAQASFQASRGTFRRLRQTARTAGAVSPLALDQARTQATSDSLNVVAARSHYQAAAQMAAYLRITAPLTGVITERNASPGALVGPGGQSAVPLFRLKQLSRLRLRVAVPEAYVGDIHAGSPVQFNVRTFPGQNFTGKIDRVAGNIANRIMDRHSKTWQKHVAPIITKLNGIMKDDGPRGGFNGANRRITSKFNKLRKSLGRVGDETPDPQNPLSGFKQNAAKVGSRVLGGIVGAGQRVKLTPGLNKVVTAPLSMATDFANGLNPFSGGELDKGDIDDLEASIKKGSISGPGTPQITSIIGLLQDWKASAETGQTQLLQHVSGIREHISSGMLAA